MILCYGCSQIDQIDSANDERKGFDSADSSYMRAHDAHQTGATDTLRYLALGDSYTIGTGVSSTERWPTQLTEKINAYQTNIHLLQPMYIAQNGWTTQALMNGMTSASVDTAAFDLVSLLIGVNNQYQGLSLEDYEAQFSELLERAIAIANNDSTRVFVVSIPDYGFTPFGASNQAEISSELAQFNASCAAISGSFGVSYYNITPISQQWPEMSNLIASDNLHPSGYQYSLWVDGFFEDMLTQCTQE